MASFAATQSLMRLSNKHALRGSSLNRRVSAKPVRAVARVRPCRAVAGLDFSVVPPVLYAQLGGVAALLGVGYALALKEEEEEALEAAASSGAAEKVAQELAETEDDGDVDIWRDTPVRYVGYSNELGEAFRPVVGGAANLTYILAIGYVIADALDKAGRSEKTSAKAQAAAIFAKLDTGGEGYLTLPEVRRAFRDLCIPLTRAQVEAFFRRADVKQNYRIDFDEFLLALDRADAELSLLLEAGAGTEWDEERKYLSNPLTVAAGVDACIWQLVASVVLPGFSINRVVTLAELLCEPFEGPLHYLPTVLGLAMIPLIIKPLDVLADVILDKTLRPVIYGFIEEKQIDDLTLPAMKVKLQNRADCILTEEELDAVLATADEDGDGMISVDGWAESGFAKYTAAIVAKKNKGRKSK